MLLLGCGAQAPPAPQPRTSAGFLRPQPAVPFRLGLDGTTPLPDGFSSPSIDPDGVRRAFMGPCTTISLRPACHAGLLLKTELALAAPARLEVRLGGWLVDARDLPPGVSALGIPIPEELLVDREQHLDLALDGVAGAAVSRLDVVVAGAPKAASGWLTAATPLRGRLQVPPDRVLVVERPPSWGDEAVELTLDAPGRTTSRLLPATPSEWRMDLRAFAHRETSFQLRIAGGRCASDRQLELPEVRLEQRQRRAGPSVVLLSLDTLRTEELGAYGSPSMATPRLDAILRGTRLHVNAYSSSHWTLPAHASLFLSASPDVHGASESAPSRAYANLAESLWDAGYRTAAFVNDIGWLGVRFGFARGFDLYRITRDHSKGRAALLRRTLRADRRRPLFLFVHFYEAHSDFRRIPYEALPIHEELWAPDRAAFPPPDIGASQALQRSNRRRSRYTPREEQALQQMYVAGLADLDAGVGVMAASLRAERVWDDAVVVLVSDHGEEFGDHGGYVHEQVYEEVTRVLMAYRIPGTAPALVHGTCSLVDVAPTILGLAGVPVRPPSWEGVDLAHGTPDRAYSFSHLGRSVVRRDGLALHRNRKGELRTYDLALDPGERTPRPYDRRRDGGELLEELTAAQKRAATQALPTQSTEAMSSEEVERLRALGYLQ